jgi:hypothetical protein
VYKTTTTGESETKDTDNVKTDYSDEHPYAQPPANADAEPYGMAIMPYAAPPGSEQPAEVASDNAASPVEEADDDDHPRKKDSGQLPTDSDSWDEEKHEARV